MRFPPLCPLEFLLMALTYYEQLRDPRWKQRRQEIIDIAEGVCEQCGDDSGKLEVHHGVYIKGKLAWEYDNEFLYALCPTCHWTLQEDLDLAYLELGKRALEMDRIRVLIKRFETREERKNWPEELNDFYKEDSNGS